MFLSAFFWGGGGGGRIRRTLADGVREQDVEENIWTKVTGSNRWLERVT